jgi:cytochrome c oxidase subunit 2
MKRDYVIAGALWLALTAVGEAAAALVDFYPVARSDKGEEIEKAFRILVAFAIPVLAFVVAVLVYSVLRHRTGDTPPEDGPAFHGRGLVPFAWFGVTTGLTFLIMVYPGLISLPKVVNNDPNPDLLVEVTGFRWQWRFVYPEHDIDIIGTPDEIPQMVLPVDRTVRFEIQSTDVLHSFFIPAFLMKADAVPGLTTVVTLRPTEIGSFQTDPMLRVQCAELCGLRHGTMMALVAVVTEQEFDEWVRAQAEPPSDGGIPPSDGEAPGASIAVGMGDNFFEPNETTVDAESTVIFDLTNGGLAIHNMRVAGPDGEYNTDDDAVSNPELFTPGAAGTLVWQAPSQPGEIIFRCDFHPVDMIGTLVVR